MIITFPMVCGAVIFPFVGWLLWRLFLSEDGNRVYKYAKYDGESKRTGYSFYSGRNPSAHYNASTGNITIDPGRAGGVRVSEYYEKGFAVYCRRYSYNSKKCKVNLFELQEGDIGKLIQRGSSAVFKVYKDQKEAKKQYVEYCEKRRKREEKRKEIGSKLSPFKPLIFPVLLLVNTFVYYFARYVLDDHFDIGLTAFIFTVLFLGAFLGQFINIPICMFTFSGSYYHNESIPALRKLFMTLVSVIIGLMIILFANSKLYEFFLPNETGTGDLLICWYFSLVQAGLVFLIAFYITVISPLFKKIKKNSKYR